MASAASDNSPVLRIRSTVIGEGERVFVLGAGPYTIGRGADCDIVLLEQAVSRKHARVERDDTGYVVIDLDSGTGLFVDGERVARRRLHDNQTLKIGDTSLQFVASAQSQATLAGGAMPTEVATNPPPSKVKPAAAPSASTMEEADTMVNAKDRPSSLPTEMPVQSKPKFDPPALSLGTEVAKHVPASPPSRFPPPSAVPTDPGVPSLDARPTPPRVPVAAAPVVEAVVPAKSASQTEVSSSAPVPAPVTPTPSGPITEIPSTPVSKPPTPAPMPGPAAPAPPVATPAMPGPAALETGSPPVLGSGPSAYELGDATRSVGPHSSQLNLSHDMSGSHVRPPSTLGASRTPVGAYVAMFVVGAAAAFGVAVALYGIP